MDTSMILWDGMLQAPDGRWFSLSYTLYQGRLILLSFFDHKPYSEPTTICFSASGAYKAVTI